MKRARKVKRLKSTIARIALLAAVMPIALAAYRHVTGNSLVLRTNIADCSSSTWLSIGLEPGRQDEHKASIDSGWSLSFPKTDWLQPILPPMKKPGDHHGFTVRLSNTISFTADALPKTPANVRLDQRTTVGKHIDASIKASGEAAKKRYSGTW